MRTNSDLDASGRTIYGEEFLLAQAHSLLNFAKGSVAVNGGFGYLDSDGSVNSDMPREAYVQCRMTQIFGLAHLLGLSDSKDLVDYGVQSLLQLFQDTSSGGFFNAIANDGQAVPGDKLAYDHMFVLLAAATAKGIGSPRANELFTLIDGIIEKYFWDEEYSLMKNGWSQDFSRLNGYRGINANMHAVEALSAAYDVTGDEKFRDRAYRISKRAVDEFARNNNWFLPEHFNEKWVPDPEFNVDNPADKFCPYGVTIGHLLEWSRLTLQVEIQMAGSGEDLSWMRQAAIDLYATARKCGWAIDGTDGFVYTIGWDGKPIVRSRMHWVVAEAAMTAYTLWKITGDDAYLSDHNQYWQFISNHHIDKGAGSWHHEISPDFQVGEGTWSGKPDVYHAFNACVLPLYSLDATFIGTALKINSAND